MTVVLKVSLSMTSSVQLLGLEEADQDPHSQFLHDHVRVRTPVGTMFVTTVCETETVYVKFVSMSAAVPNVFSSNVTTTGVWSKYSTYSCAVKP